MLQERFSVSLAFRRALDSAMDAFLRQQNLVQSLRESFLNSVSQMKVSGEDPVLLLATLSQSDPHLVFDYDNFSLLASFFGWDSPMNLSTIDPRSLADWLQASQSDSTKSLPANPPIGASLEVKSSSPGVNSAPQESLIIADQGDPNSPSISSSRESSPLTTKVDIEDGKDADTVVTSVVEDLADTEADFTLEDEDVPAPEDFLDPSVPGLDSEIEDTHTFFISLLLLFTNPSFLLEDVDMLLEN